jgi:hypothetical protein
VVIAGIFIYIGIRMLLGGCGGPWQHCRRDSIMFGESNISAAGRAGRYNTTFGKTTLDATDSLINNENKNINFSYKLAKPLFEPVLTCYS